VAKPISATTHHGVDPSSLSASATYLLSSPGIRLRSYEIAIHERIDSARKLTKLRAGKATLVPKLDGGKSASGPGQTETREVVGRNVGQACD